MIYGLIVLGYKMKTRRLTVLLVALALASAVAAQEAAPSPPKAGRREPRVVVGPQTPAPPRVSQPAPAPRARVGADQSVEMSGEVRLKLEKGGKVSLSTSSGSITVTGWDQETVEAKATGDSGPEPIAVDTSRSLIQLDVSRSRNSRTGRESVVLDVKVPRYASVELIDIGHSEVQVTGIAGAVSVGSGAGRVTLNDVGPSRILGFRGDVVANGVKGDLLARTGSGDLSIGNVAGAAEMASSSGDITLRSAGGDVRVTSASGDIAIACGKGRAQISSASGSISLTGMGGDVEAHTASGDITFRGPIRAAGSYRIKTLSGEAEMAIQEDPPGFTATLITYNGEVETVFPLKIGPSTHGGPINRRITGQYGDGKAQLTLDSFSGSVRITKMAPGAGVDCK